MSGKDLIEAASRGDRVIVERLLEQGVDVNYSDGYGNTALRIAAGHSDIVELLLKYEADPNEQKKYSGNTALHDAASKGHTDTVELLLKYKADPNKQDKSGLTALHEAANRHCGIVELLLRHKADPNKQDKRNGWTPLHGAALVGHRDVVEVLLKYKADPNKQDKYGDTALHDAASERHGNIVELLLKYSADPNKQDKFGDTALHKAANKGHSDIVELLLKYSADPNKQTEYGDTALHIAARYGHSGVVDVLLKYNADPYKKNKNGKDALQSHVSSLYKYPMSIARLVSLRCISQPLLTNLKQFDFKNNPLTQFPSEIKAAPFQELFEYLRAVSDDTVENRMVKLIIHGQEGVGKTTLVNALARYSWLFGSTPQALKTDGLDVSLLDIGDVQYKVFDFGGDLDFVETHNFFITQSAVHLSCFNMAEFTPSTYKESGVLFGRLQMWLQNSQVRSPGSAVIIIGTHADHSILNPAVRLEIWQQLKYLLEEARPHHQALYRNDARPDCLLCQPADKVEYRNADEGKPGHAMTNEDPIKEKDMTGLKNQEIQDHLLFPHIIGYYEVSSTTKVGSAWYSISNESIEQLKRGLEMAGKTILRDQPMIPQKWEQVRSSLIETAKIQPLKPFAEYRAVAIATRIEEKDIKYLTAFLRDRGDILHYPAVEKVENTIFSDPQWLGKRLCSFITFRETGFKDGLISVNVINECWSDLETEVCEKLLDLFRYFGICFPLEGAGLELFPCKLPVGYPSRDLWPLITSVNDTERQVTYVLSFPFIPPALFSRLIVLVERESANGQSKGLVYFANHIIESRQKQTDHCELCNLHFVVNSLCKVHYELKAHVREIWVSIRGKRPCCHVNDVKKLLEEAVSDFDGLYKFHVDSIGCPQCTMCDVLKPCLLNEMKLKEIGHRDVLCDKGHQLSSATGVLLGEILPSYLPRNFVDANGDPVIDDNNCPKLVAVFPINKNGFTFLEHMKMFVSSIFHDGYSVHLLCEFPGGIHLNHKDAGFRLNNSSEFWSNHGYLVSLVLEYIAASNLVGSSNPKESPIFRILEDLHRRHPETNRGAVEMNPERIMSVIDQQKQYLSRTRLRKYLNLADQAGRFGPLMHLCRDGRSLWLCREHFNELVRK